MWVKRNREYRRRMRARHIRHKLYICRNCMSWQSLPTAGKLSKGKVHCSCCICARKSTKAYGAHTNSLRGYPAKDIRKFNSAGIKT